MEERNCTADWLLRRHPHWSALPNLFLNQRRSLGLGSRSGNGSGKGGVSPVRKSDLYDQICGCHDRVMSRVYNSFLGVIGRSEPSGCMRAYEMAKSTGIFYVDMYYNYALLFEELILAGFVTCFIIV